MSLRQSPAVFLLLGLVALIVAGCGRAGPLEAPPRKAAQAQASQGNATSERVAVSSSGQDLSDFDTDDGSMPSPLPTPRTREPKRGLTIPNRPFLLDPLL